MTLINFNFFSMRSLFSIYVWAIVLSLWVMCVCADCYIYQSNQVVVARRHRSEQVWLLGVPNSVEQCMLPQRRKNSGKTCVSRSWVGSRTGSVCSLRVIEHPSRWNKIFDYFTPQKQPFLVPRRVEQENKKTVHGSESLYFSIETTSARRERLLKVALEAAHKFCSPLKFLDWSRKVLDTLERVIENWFMEHKLPTFACIFGGVQIWKVELLSM